MTNSIRWGIIGCGDVTEQKSGPAFAKVPNSALVAVMRRDAAKAADYARRHNVPKHYGDAAALIHDPDVDAVYVATPPDTHELYTLMAAKAKKPVYVEKPMARSYEECKRMVHACRAAGVKLFVAYYRRALPRFLKVRELLESGEIGHLRFVNVRHYQPPLKEDLDPGHLPWRVLPDVAGGGRFVDLAAHTLDLLDYLLGPVADARGHAANQARLYPAEDVVTASLRFESGVLATGVWCFTSHHREETVELIGDQGRITFSVFGNDPVILESSGNADHFEIPHPDHIQQPMIEMVVNDLLGNSPSPSTGETGARTSRVIDQILNDHRQHAPL